MFLLFRGCYLVLASYCVSDMVTVIDGGTQVLAVEAIEERKKKIKS